MQVTRDKRFVTVRQSLVSLQKIRSVNSKLRETVADRLTRRFHDCIEEKNCTLIRYGILEVFRKIYDKALDEHLQARGPGPD